MASIWINRAIIVASWVGVFIAGVLTYAHLFGLSPPCGAEQTTDCAALAKTEYSEVFNVPVAISGLAAYLSLAALAVVREWANARDWRRLSWLGFAISSLGLVISILLSWYALSVENLSCEWCLASCGAMIVLFLLHAGLAQASQAEYRTPGHAVGATVISLVLVAMAMVPTVRAMGDASGLYDQVTFEVVSLEQVMPGPERSIGPRDAPVKIIEFADINCGACRESYAEVEELIEKYEGDVYYAFRHFPLIGAPGHQTSTTAAVLAEFAASKGRFWDYMDAVMAEKNVEQVKTEAGLTTIIHELGLDTAEAQAAVTAGQTSSGPAFARVSEDFIVSQELQLRGTPTFLIYVEGLEPRAEDFLNLKRYLESREVQEAMGR